MSLMRNNQVKTQKQNKKPWNCEMASFLFTTNLHVTETLLKKIKCGGLRDLPGMVRTFSRDLIVYIFFFKLERTTVT